MSDLKILINGKEQSPTISVFDRGLQYGDGLFETMAVLNGKAEFLLPHLERLQQGCQRLGFPLIVIPQLIQEIESFLVGSSRAVLKLLLTRGIGGRGYLPPTRAETNRILLLYPWPQYDDAHWRHGIKVQTCATPVSANPVLAGMKHLNRLDNVLARAELAEDVAEGLMLDITGAYLVEGTMSNLFAVRGKILYTPSLAMAGVRGLMRQQIISWAASLKLELQEGRYSPDWFAQAGELFVSNSLIGIWPIRHWKDRTWPVGPVTKQLMSRLNLKDRGVHWDG